MDGHCGLLAAWMVLRHFKKRVSASDLKEACRYTKRHGVFTIGLAAGLKSYGLRVSFYTDPDFQIGGFERRCYAHAARMGLCPQPALELSAILEAQRAGAVPIVLFNSESNVGHFSPLLGVHKRVLNLPLAEGERMRMARFLERWSEPDILRQCVIAAD
jgi:hypothetical protein